MIGMLIRLATLAAEHAALLGGKLLKFILSKSLRKLLRSLKGQKIAVTSGGAQIDGVLKTVGDDYVIMDDETVIPIASISQMRVYRLPNTQPTERT